MKNRRLSLTFIPLLLSCNFLDINQDEIKPNINPRNIHTERSINLISNANFNEQVA